MKPIRQRIYDTLAAKIAGGSYLPGEKLPSEKELAEAFSASSTPVRQAMERLVLEGQVERFRGRGSFVSQSVRRMPRILLSSFSEYYESQIGEIAVRTLEVSQKRLPQVVAEALQVSSSSTVTYVRRLRSVAGTPVSYHRYWFSPVITPTPFRVDLTFMVMTTFLADRLGIRCTSAIEAVRAILPSKDEQRLLCVAPQTPLLQVERRTYDANGEPVLYDNYVVNSGMWEYKTTLGAY